MNLRSLVVAPLVALVASTTVGTASAQPAAAAESRIDVATMKVVNKKKRVSLVFTYDQAPADLWWGAHIYFDTKAKRKGPEFGAFIDNQCGSGMAMGPVKRVKGGYGLDWARMKPWTEGCGPQPSGRCAKSYRTAHTKSGHLRRLTVRKVKGCMNPKRVRVTAEFRSNDLGDRNSTPSYDQVPGKKNAYTKWVKQGQTRTFKDRS